MVLKQVGLPVGRPKVHSKLLEDNKRAQLLKTLQNVKYPKRVTKEVRNLDQPSYSRTSFSPPSSERRTIHPTSNSRKWSPTLIPVFPTLSQTLRWDPYVKTTIIPDVTGIEVPPYQEKLHDDSDTPLSSNINRNKELYPPYMFQPAVRDEPVRTLKNNIVEYNDQSTMTIEQSSVGCGSSSSISEPRFSDMFIPSSVTPVSDTQEDVHAVHYPTQRPGEHSLYRTGSYLEPVMMKPSHHQYYRPVNCVRPMRNRVISDITNHCTQRIQCEFPMSKKCIREEKKVLYNEGIFDFQPYRPKHRTLRTPPSTPMRIGSKNRISTKSFIPFSHNNDSKYHNCCVRSMPRSVTRGHQVCSGTQKQSKDIAWPKRVLASEQDIDAFLYSEPAIYLSRNKPEQWTMCPHKFPGEL